VQDGVGQVLPLTTNQKNQICFDGGAPVLERAVLHQIGKSGKRVSFRHLSPEQKPRERWQCTTGGNTLVVV